MEGWGALCWSTQTDGEPSSSTTSADASAADVAAGAVLVDGGVPSHDVAATMVGATIMERIAKVRCQAALWSVRRPLGLRITPGRFDLAGHHTSVLSLHVRQNATDGGKVGTTEW